jgi:hypothetical protein
MLPEYSNESFELRCYPCHGGFSVSISAPIGSSYSIEYYAIGGGGYHESGVISGTISSRPEVVGRAATVPIIEVGAISISLSPVAGASARSAISETRTASILDRRTVPQGEVETICSNEGDSVRLWYRTK